VHNYTVSPMLAADRSSNLLGNLGLHVPAKQRVLLPHALKDLKTAIFFSPLRLQELGPLRALALLKLSQSVLLVPRCCLQLLPRLLNQGKDTIRFVGKPHGFCSAVRKCVEEEECVCGGGGGGAPAVLTCL
jgi:hypothetical protein